MWPNTFNKKCATISGWQALGDFAHVKQQLQKIRASTRLSSRRSTEDSLRNGNTRPLPPLPPHHNSNGGGGVGAQGNKSVRFNIPDGGLALPSGSEGSDQGYESDQSRERRRQLESQTAGRLGMQSADLGVNSGSSPVLLQLYDAVKVDSEEKHGQDEHVKAALARLASSENLNSSYDLVLGLVRRQQGGGGGGGHHECGHHGHTSLHSPPSPPPQRHHCPCHTNHHRCSSGNSRKSRSRPASPGLMTMQHRESRSRPCSPSPGNTRPPPPQSSGGQQQNKFSSRWSFVRKAKRSASADRKGQVEFGWGAAHSLEPHHTMHRGRYVDKGDNALGKWEDTGSRGWEFKWEGSVDISSATATATLAGELCRRATALRRTLHKMPALINHRNAFLEIIKDVASEMKLLLDAAGRLAPLLPDQQRQDLDLSRRKLLETSRSFSNALKGYFKEPHATPVLLAATALVYRTDEIVQSLEP